MITLKLHGPGTAASVGKKLGITAEAARQQLIRLQKEGLVVSEAQQGGVGRPKQIWLLTQTGHASFPDRHAEMTVGLITAIRQEFGEAALDRLIALHESDVRIRYEEQMEGALSLEERIARLAEIRTREGYMTDWHETPEGYVLVENHCPICAAASVCQGFCRAELDLFQTLLGPGVSVKRISHIVQGDRRCTYHIAPFSSVPDKS